jgi:hypothetical protein
VSESNEEISPPTSEEWSRFIAKLTLARRIQASAARSADLPNDLHADFAACWTAFEAVLVLLTGRPDIAKDGLAYPLVQLGFALSDVQNGRPPPLLRPHKRKGTNSTKGAPATAEFAVMASAALALDELIEAGEPREAAALKVARVIEAARIPVQPRRGATLMKTILGWRDRISVGDGEAPDQVLRMWEAYQRNKTQDGCTPCQRAERLLRDLRKNEAYRFY